MKLEGSCHCGAVRFALQSATPQPYMQCYCSICRKTAGGGGYAINLGGDAESLEVEGEEPEHGPTIAKSLVNPGQLAGAASPEVGGTRAIAMLPRGGDRTPIYPTAMKLATTSNF